MLVILILLSILLPLLYIHIKKKHSYWAELGVETPPINFFFGHFGNIFTRKGSVLSLLNDAYHSTTQRYVGLYAITTPIFFVKDPELIRDISIKHFEYFHDHKLMENEPSLWQKNLLSLKGEDWKIMRSTLSPVFTGAKMRYMFKLITKALDDTTDFLNKGSSTFNVELKSFCSRLTTDLIGSTVFGVTTNSLQNPSNEFYEMANKLTEFGFRKQILFLCHTFAPNAFKNISIFPAKPDNFLRRLVKESVEAREKHVTSRTDIIQILTQAKKSFLEYEKDSVKEGGISSLDEAYEVVNKKQKKLITDDDIAAQCSIFLFAGNETMSTACSFLLYELAVNSNVQEKLYKEIQEVRERIGKEVSYEDIVDMKYLHMVILESLRKWPPANALDRKCTKDYTIEAKLPGEHSITIPKGTQVWMAVTALQNDPKYFPEPEVFNPERFNGEDKNALKNFMSFGIGPRNCIGYRLSLLCLKVIIFKILEKYEVTVTEKTPIPLILGNKHVNLNSSTAMCVGLKPREIM